MQLFTNPDSKEMIAVGEILKNGGLVAFPTETVYGLGADVFNTKAVARIFEVKKRPYFDPLICHIADIDTADKLGFITNRDLFDKLTKAFWPGPLTIILPKTDKVPDIITGGLDTVAIRMPANQIALDLIKYSTGAVAAPSANPFGYLSPTKAIHVINTIGSEIEAVIDGGAATFGIESTVIDITTDKPQILRYGALAVEDIENVLGCSLEYYANINKLKFKSPGQIKKHYSPTKKIVLWENISELETADFKRSAILFFSEVKGDYPFKEAVSLSKNGDFVEAASNLFELLHELEECDIDTIYAEMVPQLGLGRAIQDRLNRASAK